MPFVRSVRWYGDCSISSLAFRKGTFMKLNLLLVIGATAIAYERVFSTRRDRSEAPSNDELDLVALALSLHLPIYGVRAAEEAAETISEPELMEGMFWGGAARFEAGTARESCSGSA